MSKIIIVSNRLPVSVTKSKNGIKVKPSVGGLATGMKSIYKEMESLWIGWPGIDKNNLDETEVDSISFQLKRERCEPLYIDGKDMDLYYNGFSNKTIWPLFHYFPQFTDYDKLSWEAYVKVNRLFYGKVADLIGKNDQVWIHDYHLLLLPKMIKDVFPDTTIGFFNHIPFPSYELFRLLPWRKEILEGMLGADLIGFHTYDYERHFNSCVRRLFGYDYELNHFNLGDRVIKVDSFPMGIDYRKFINAATKTDETKNTRLSGLKKAIARFHQDLPEGKIILSIDRMDYSKGIPNRLYAFQRFLEKYPEYHGKVSMVMLAVPSRSRIKQYQLLKNEVDQLVGKINGEYGKLNWTPVWYFYRSMAFSDLILLYKNADIALITPLRDGMNLVAKEYIATRTAGNGVLILSEMAGSSKEMTEAILINPNNPEEIADAIKLGIEMPEDEQVRRNTNIQRRLARYTVEKWTSEFLSGMKQIESTQKKYISKRINNNATSDIQKKFAESKRSLLFLDYNGTLVKRKDRKEYTAPDKGLYEILDNFKLDETVDIVLVSSCEKELLEQWFGSSEYWLFAEHGMWQKKGRKHWQQTSAPRNDEWKTQIRSVIETYVDRTPGSYLEDMNSVLSWHFENVDKDHGLMRALELKDELANRIHNMDLQIIEGKAIIEIRPSAMNKGIAVLNAVVESDYELIIAMGDDYTDEYFFEQLPESAISVSVGFKKTVARYQCKSHNEVRDLLRDLAKISRKQTIAI